MATICEGLCEGLYRAAECEGLCRAAEFEENLVCEIIICEAGGEVFFHYEAIDEVIDETLYKRLCDGLYPAAEFEGRAELRDVGFDYRVMAAMRGSQTEYSVVDILVPNDTAERNRGAAELQYERLVLSLIHI